jgi:hypothetical protein
MSVRFVVLASVFLPPALGVAGCAVVGAIGSSIASTIAVDGANPDISNRHQ